MKNILKIALSFIFASIFSTGTVFAGEYSETGYITSVKVNDSGSNCFLTLSKRRNGKTLQGGIWKCNSAVGQGMFQLASFAQWHGLEVVVTYEGNGAEYKPVYSIERKKEVVD